MPLALVCWQCGAKEQAADERPRPEKEARQASWSDDLAGEGWCKKCDNGGRSWVLMY